MIAHLILMAALITATLMVTANRYLRSNGNDD